MAAGRGAYFGPSLFNTEDHFLNINAATGVVTGTMARTHYPLEATAPEAEKPYDEELGRAAGQHTAGAPRTEQNVRGWLEGGFGDDVLFNQIYVDIVDLSTDPNSHYGQSHDVGFITEEITTYTVLVWNSYLAASKSLTAISVVNSDGISLTYPSLPHVITPNGETQMPVTIAKNGPAVQDSTYTFTVGGVQRTAAFQGLRALAMVPEPDWRRGISHRFAFHTAMFQTERYHEQRRSMIDAPIHSTAANYLMLDDEAQQFFHRLSYGHDKVFAVPFYSEMMIPTDTGIPQGDVTLTLDTTQADPDDMWNLNNGVTYIAIIDHENRMAEIKKISSISSPNIVVTQNVAASFDEGSTRVYPIYFGLVRAATLQQESAGIDSVRLDFMEFNNG